MPTVSTRPPAVQTPQLTAAQIEARFRSVGFLPGTPPGLKPETVIIDRSLCRRSRCPRCRRGGLEYRPFYRRDRQTGESHYRIVAACRQCGHGEEL